MKKVYIQPEWKLSIFEQQDVITTSTTVTYDPNGLFGEGTKTEDWIW